MRLFVAVPIPEDIRSRVAALAGELPLEGIKPVSKEIMHITLKFIGETNREKEIEEKLRKVVFSPFECNATGVGVFPSPSYIKVVWAGIESNGALEALASQVNGLLHGFGDERFSPHMTIARVKKKIDASAFLQKHAKEEFGKFTVSHFELMQSVLQKGGPEYSVLAKFEAK